jgi:hypothetical protein
MTSIWLWGVRRGEISHVMRSQKIVHLIVWPKMGTVDGSLNSQYLLFMMKGNSLAIIFT